MGLGGLYEKHDLPKNPEMFFDQLCRKVDTKQLLEIVQVFTYQQDRTSSGNKESHRVNNDYSVIVLKINSK